MIIDWINISITFASFSLLSLLHKICPIMFSFMQFQFLWIYIHTNSIYCFKTKFNVLLNRIFFLLHLYFILLKIYIYFNGWAIIIMSYLWRCDISRMSLSVYIFLHHKWFSYNIALFIAKIIHKYCNFDFNQKSVEFSISEIIWREARVKREIYRQICH